MQMALSATVDADAKNLSELAATLLSQIEVKPKGLEAASNKIILKECAAFDTEIGKQKVK